MVDKISYLLLDCQLCWTLISLKTIEVCLLITIIFDTDIHQLDSVMD